MYYPRFFCMTHFSMTRAISSSIHISLDSLWFKLCLGIRFLWIKPIFFGKIAKNQYSVLRYKSIWVRPEAREYLRISLVTKRSRKSTMENSRNVGGKKSLRRKRRCSVFRPCLCFNVSLLFQLDFWNGTLRCQGALWIFLCWERFSVLHPVMYQPVWSL